MKRRILSALLCFTMSVAMLAGCGGKDKAGETPEKQEDSENTSTESVAGVDGVFTK